MFATLAIIFLISSGWFRSLSDAHWTRGDKGRTPLACAADAGDVDWVVKLLASADIDVDERDYDGCTPLALAARNGHATVIEKLLAHDANPSLRDLQQVAPLWIAAKHGYVSVVRLLLESEGLSDVNPRPLKLYPHGTGSPLSIALVEGHQETAGLLAYATSIDISMETDIVDPKTGILSLLGLAVRDGREDVALTLLDKCDLGHGSKDAVESSSRLLVFAAYSGCYRIAQELLAKRGANPNAVYEYAIEGDRDCVQQSPLMAASRRGHAGIVRLLLDTDGIHPGLSVDDGTTALILAASGGFLDVVKMLLAHPRVEADHKNKHGRTALSYAAEHTHEVIVAELLATGVVDPNGQDYWAQTPLYYAAHNNAQGIVTAILEHPKTDPEGENEHSALVWAAREGYTDVVRVLLNSGRADVNAADTDNCFIGLPLIAASGSGKQDVVRLLLSFPGIDPNAQTFQGRTALINASENGKAEVVEQLLAAGADPNLEGRSGDIPLMKAARNGQAEVVEQLLAAGVDPNLQNLWETTPLMEAAQNGQAEVIRQLLAAGVDPNIQDNKGKTALCNAAGSSCSTEMAIRVLVEAPGVNADLPDNMGRTALSLAAEAGSFDNVVTLLTVDGVNPDARDATGRSPLSWVFSRYLQRMGPDGADRQRERLLDDHKAIVRRLLDIPTVDPNAVDAEGLTPLLRAVSSYHSSQFVELLLSRPGLDVNCQGPDGLSPLAVAKRAHDTVTMALLRARGATMPEDAASGIPRTTNSRPDPCSEYRLALGGQQAYIHEWAAGSTTGLCAVCIGIDLDDAFSSRHSIYRGRAIADLGRVDKTWEERTCPLCRLFAAVRPNSSIQGTHKLLSLSITQSWLCDRKSVCWDILGDNWVDMMVLAVVADSVFEGLPDGSYIGSSYDEDVIDNVKVADSVISAGLIGRLGSNCPDQKHGVIIPRLAGGSDLRMSTARDWITCCHQNHTGRCNPTSLATVPHFYLIECSTRRVLLQEQSEAGRPPRYVALSYVWGQPPSDQQQHRSVGESLGVIPAVVEDAIRVTLELGYEYLWVDRYCIIQTGSETIKQEQLRHMHTVYANAEVTLVDAAGEGTSTGLLGAPGRPRVQQPGALIKGHALVCIPPDPTYHIRSGTTWATRGWTYQEGLVSRRRLFFSKYEMSYECRDMLCREALRLPPAVEQRMPRQGLRFMDPHWMYTRRMLPQMGFSRDGTGLFVLLEVYSARQLSKPLDTLNAMLGILQLLAQHKHRPVYHVCGVPVLYTNDKAFDINDDSTVADPTPLDSDEDSIPVHFRFNDKGPAPIPLDGFLNGLCWHLQQPARRRPDFPSWSWAGWQGRIKRMDSNMPYIMQSFGFNIDVSIMARYGGGHVGSAVPWNRYFDQLRTADDSSKDLWSGQKHVLEITASAATVRFRRPADASKVPSEWTGIVCVGNDVWQGQFSLTFSGEGDSNVVGTESLMSQLVQEPWVGIVLGNARPLPRNMRETHETHETCVLVVQEEQNQKQPAADGHVYWERVGLLKLDNCTLKEGMLERRTWRLK
ncbi:hypothetical protein CEP51_006679 [Fusarium floridanum]|uniref:Heterokaryon incompatibility domain-containing protein n=1 Tax=Fusarium floridanum TaxID=1325733 RepID=A0A428RRV5_9HYPO|nr:hypothetical protein CEP51_006679 [Fusarium floridanum]